MDPDQRHEAHAAQILFLAVIVADAGDSHELLDRMRLPDRHHQSSAGGELASQLLRDVRPAGGGDDRVEGRGRSEEHTSELQSLMRISYAVSCLKKKKTISENPK